MPADVPSFRLHFREGLGATSCQCCLVLVLGARFVCCALRLGRFVLVLLVYGLPYHSVCLLRLLSDSMRRVLVVLILGSINAIFLFLAYCNLRVLSCHCLCHAADHCFSLK